MNARAGYIAGLRQLADLLEANSTLPLPYQGVHEKYGKLSFYCESRDEMASLVRAIGGRFDKRANDSEFEMHGAIAGIHIAIYAHRDQVCRRVVKGTRQVTEEVPTGFETVTKTVEDVVWVCEPLLAEAAS